MGPVTIESFSGPYDFLSNFYPCQIYYEGRNYKSVEHAYQAAKTLDPKERVAIQLAPTAAKAKRLGQAVTMRKDWEDVKVEVMRQLLVKKFSNPGLAQRLLDTRNSTLIEGNYWGDTFWGVCESRGRNYLGRLLMEVRKTLRGKDDDY